MVMSVGGTEPRASKRQRASFATPADLTGELSDPDQLIGRARNGDPDAISDLYSNHVVIVFGYLRANGCANPEDATADVFEGMLKSIHRFKGGDRDFRSWLMTIAHRRLIDSRRRTARRGHDRPLNESVIAGLRRRERTSAAVDESAYDTDLVDAIAELTSDQRQVIGLRFIADLPIDEVATITGRSVTGVKALQRRGLAALRRALDERAQSRSGGER